MVAVLHVVYTLLGVNQSVHKLLSKHGCSWWDTPGTSEQKALQHWYHCNRHTRSVLQPHPVR